MKIRAVHAGYGLLVAVLSCFIVYYSERNTAITRMENQAAALLAATKILINDGSRRGFILAGLVLLEKNSHRFPDTYDMAKEMALAVGVTKREEDDAMKRLYQWWKLQDGANAMRSILTGISVGVGTQSE